MEGPLCRVEDGGTLHAATASVAEFSGSTANVTITDPGSSINVTGALDLGGSGGAAAINLLNGGILNVPDANTTINSLSAINIDGGTFNSGFISGLGNVNIATGKLHVPNAASFLIFAPLFDENLALNANAAISSANDIRVDASMNLHLRGGALAADELTNNGNINHNAGTISASTLINNNDLILGSTTNAIVDASLENSVSGTVSGPGTITNQLRNIGRVNLTGHTLHIQGAATNQFNGLFIGNGTLQADGGIINASGATMAFSGPTNIIGDVHNQDLPLLGGPPLGLIVSSGPGPLTFFDDVINDGEIRTNTNGFTVMLGAASGTGIYTGAGTVVFEADFTPGASPGSATLAATSSLAPLPHWKLRSAACLPEVSTIR